MCERRGQQHRPASQMTEDTAALRTVGLTKDYGSGRGVFDLDLEVRPGEIFGFLGPNGAGKTTTMRMLVGLIGASSGSAQVLGHDVQRESLAIRAKIGYLAGDFGLYPKLTGSELLEYFATLSGGVPSARIGELAERLNAQLDRPMRELSTGNRQKIGLIQALMPEPQLLILDEPIAGLDPLVQQSFHALLAEARTQGRTVFLSSHTLSEVERVADRVAVLRAGRLVVVDTLQSLRAVALRRLDIQFASPPELETFRRLPGVRDAQLTEDHELRVAFEGSADALIKAAAAHEVLSIRSREDDLEEIFLSYYAEQAQ